MMEIELLKFIDKNVIVKDRYGFKKKVEEIQTYEGKLIRIDEFRVISQHEIRDLNDIIVNDLFLWHNIDAIRYRKLSIGVDVYD